LHSVDHLGLGLMEDDPIFDPEFSEPPPNWVVTISIFVLIGAMVWIWLH